jgi:hypothetical protein
VARNALRLADLAPFEGAEQFAVGGAKVFPKARKHGHLVFVGWFVAPMHGSAVLEYSYFDYTRWGFGFVWLCPTPNRGVG